MKLKYGSVSVYTKLFRYGFGIYHKNQSWREFEYDIIIICKFMTQNTYYFTQIVYDYIYISIYACINSSVDGYGRA